MTGVCPRRHGDVHPHTTMARDLIPSVTTCNMTWVIKTDLFRETLNLKQLAITVPYSMRAVWSPLMTTVDGTRSTRAALKLKHGHWGWPTRSLNCLELKLCTWCMFEHKRASRKTRCTHRWTKQSRSHLITVNIWSTGVIKLVNVKTTLQSHFIANWLLYNLRRYTRRPLPCVSLTCRLCVSQVDFKVGGVIGIKLSKSRTVLGLENTEFEEESYHGLRYTPGWAKDGVTKINIFKTAKAFVSTSSASGCPERAAASFCHEIFNCLYAGGALVVES